MNIILVPTAAARRLLLGAQGLLADPTRKATPTTLAKLIDQMGFVQIDSINVVERAQHLTLGSRLDNYRHEHFAHLLETKRHLFEHWTHDASVIPTAWFQHWQPRFKRYEEKLRSRPWWMQRIGTKPDKVLDAVRERIALEGPLRSQDFEHDRKGQAAGWWDWKPQKAALEYLWFTGELMVTRREKFQKVYDLTERVLPALATLPHPTEAEHIEWACRTAFERLVIATPKEIAEFWHSISIVQAKQWCEQAVQTGVLVAVLVEATHGKPRASFALRDWAQRLKKLPAPPDRMRLLSPFDPVLRDRARAARLFGFDYRFEAFVPEPQRKYGYYVLPILEGDRLIGRINPKFQRDRGVLEVRQVYWEPTIRVTKARQRKLEEALLRLAKLIGAERFEISLTP